MKQQLLIGLKGSCKTTFLGALWALINSTTAETVLVLDRLPDDRERLDRIAQAWLAGQEVSRTESQTEGWVELQLRPRHGGAPTLVSLPDLSGEGFLAQWVTRVGTVEYMAAASSADGVMLFIHSVGIRQSPELSTMLSMALALAKRSDDRRPEAEPTGRSGTPLPARGMEAAIPPPVAWDAELAPTQVQLVELLQIIQQTSPFRRRRLAVVLTAWDLVPTELGFTPARYLEEQLPLLAQFLDSNRSILDTRVYGISPLGAEMGSEAFRARLGLHPEQRIFVDDGSREPGLPQGQEGAPAGFDLTAILDWCGCADA